MEIFAYFSIVFLLLALLLKPFNLKISFLLLCISSTIFCVIDNDIVYNYKILLSILQINIIVITIIYLLEFYKNGNICIF